MTEAARSVTHCLGTRTDGHPCESTIVSKTTGYCFSHDPNAEEDRTKARRRGDHASSAVSRTSRLAPASLRAVYSILEKALSEVHGGELSPARASAMASLARAMTYVLTAGELEERVRAVEESLDFAAS